MKQVKLTITDNTEIAANVWRMVLSGDTSGITAPGQFINIALPGHFLRRPISVSDYSSESVTILYKTAGEGTTEMTAFPSGTCLDVLTGLGNGFNAEKAAKRGKALLLGGGIGSAPMLALCRELVGKGVSVEAVLGFNSAADIILEEELKNAGARVTVMTMDGSSGKCSGVSYGHGTAVEADVIRKMTDAEHCYYYACGPVKMLRSVYQSVSCDGELSFEERMGCGFGACMGCTMHTVNGARRVCKDGPVFEKQELLF